MEYAEEALQIQTLFEGLLHLKCVMQYFYYSGSPSVGMRHKILAGGEHFGVKSCSKRSYIKLLFLLNPNRC